MQTHRFASAGHAPGNDVRGEAHRLLVGVAGHSDSDSCSCSCVRALRGWMKCSYGVRREGGTASARAGGVGNAGQKVAGAGRRRTL